CALARGRLAPPERATGPQRRGARVMKPISGARQPDFRRPLHPRARNLKRGRLAPCSGGGQRARRPACEFPPTPDPSLMKKALVFLALVATASVLSARAPAPQTFRPVA